jgi:hypothetical protein
MHHTGKPARGPAADQGSALLWKTTGIVLWLATSSRRGETLGELRLGGGQAIKHAPPLVRG